MFLKLICLILGIFGLSHWLGDMDIKSNLIVYKVGIADRESRLYLIEDTFVKKHHLKTTHPQALFWGKIVILEYQGRYLEIPRSVIYPLQGEYQNTN